MPDTGASIRLFRILGAVVVTVFMVSAFTPLPNLVSDWLAIPSRIERAEAIVVLGGGGVWGDGMPSDTSLRRAVRGIVLHRQGFAPLLVFSGSEAEIEARVAVARTLGIPPERILADPGSYTTRDEATRLRALLEPRGVRTILLVTDSQHMIRAQRLFGRGGFRVLAAAADDFSTTATGPEGRLHLARVICGEILARLYYRVAGFL